MDAYAKTVLTVIAACLLLQVAQGFGLAGAPGPGQTSSSSAESADRYMMQPIPMLRLLFRFDRMTGETWTMPFQANKERLWTAVGEAPPTPIAREQDEEVPPPPEKAGEAEK